MSSFFGGHLLKGKKQEIVFRKRKRWEMHCQIQGNWWSSCGCCRDLASKVGPFAVATVLIHLQIPKSARREVTPARGMGGLLVIAAALAQK